MIVHRDIQWVIQLTSNGYTSKVIIKLTMDLCCYLGIKYFHLVLFLPVPQAVNQAVYQSVKKAVHKAVNEGLYQAANQAANEVTS